MKKILLTSVIAIALFTPHPALAEWVRVVGSRSGTSLYIDEDSIAQDGRVVGYRLKMDDGRARTIGTVLADCITSQFQYQQLTVNGETVHPNSSEFPIQPAPAVQYACGTGLP